MLYRVGIFHSIKIVSMQIAVSILATFMIFCFELIQDKQVAKLFMNEPVTVPDELSSYKFIDTYMERSRLQ